MNWYKVYGLSLRHFLFNKEFLSKNFRFNLLAINTNISWGFISKFFTLSSTYYNNTVGVILSAAILYDFLFRSSISYNMMFLEEIWSRNFTNFLFLQ